MQTIKGFEISHHEKSKRIYNIKISDQILEKLLFSFNKFDLTALELKPFSRFTIAKSLDDLTDRKLGNLMNSILRDRNTGCFIISPLNKNSKLDENFFVKLSTAISHLIGNPNHDSMAGKYYARFHVKHEDKSDSYLRKAYKNMDLHTDGTYVKETTDWLLMTKLEEKNAELKKVVSSIKKGYEFSILNPEKSIDSLINIAGKEIVEEEVERAGIKLLIPMWQSESVNFGYQDLSKWYDTYNWMNENKFLDKSLNIEDLVYTNFSN